MDVPDHLEPLRTAEETAAILRRHPRTVLELAKTGELASVRIGPHGIRFLDADIAAYIEAHRVTS